MGQRKVTVIEFSCDFCGALSFEPDDFGHPDIGGTLEFQMKTDSAPKFSSLTLCNPCTSEIIDRMNDH